MKVKFPGKLRSFADLKHGSIFMAAMGGSSRYCMKSFEVYETGQPDEDKEDSFVVLSPGLPDLVLNRG